MITIFGRLTAEDKARLWQVKARLNAIDDNPRVYSAIDTEQAYMASFKLYDEFARTYGLPDDGKWSNDTYSEILSTYGD